MKLTNSTVAKKLLPLFVLGLLAALASAHPANMAAATVKVDTDGSFTLRLRFDLLAFALNETPQQVTDAALGGLVDAPDQTLRVRLKDTETRLREGIESGTGLRTLSFPALSEVTRVRTYQGPRRLLVTGTATFEGKLPPGERKIAFRFPAALDTVILTTEFPYQEPISEPVPAGERSRPLSIPTPGEVAASARAMGVPAPIPPKPNTVPPPKVKGSQGTPGGTRGTPPATTKAPPKEAAAPASKPTDSAIPPKDTATPGGDPKKASSPKARPPTPGSSEVTPKNGEQTAAPLPAGNGAQRNEATDARAPVATPSAEVVSAAPVGRSNRQSPLVDIPRYIEIGFLHILPKGLDHVLFVLGLVLVAVRRKDLLTQVSAFTLAHSLTLGLALFGIVRLPERIVEPIIAASIAFVAIENIWAKKVGPWRLAVVFVFGLIHGLGFAGALQETGLARRDFLPALIGFNVGVELGQLAVVAMALGVIGGFREHANYRKWVVIPASGLIAAIALFWTVERLLTPA